MQVLRKCCLQPAGCNCSEKIANTCSIPECLLTHMDCVPRFCCGELQCIPCTAGNTCEPWMARFAIVMLDQLLDTGASPQWGADP